MSKLLKNKIVLVAIAVIVLSLVLLFVPGFAHYGYIGNNNYTYTLSGYEFIFNLKKNMLDKSLGASAVGQGIAIFVMLIVTCVGLCFSHKSSFVTMLCGLSLLVISILFFAIAPAAAKAYPTFPLIEGHSYIGWVTYFLGAINVIAAGLVIYQTVMMMKDEIKHPTKSNNGPTYNYLKK